MPPDLFDSIASEYANLDEAGLRVALADLNREHRPFVQKYYEFAARHQRIASLLRERILRAALPAVPIVHASVKTATDSTGGVPATDALAAKLKAGERQPKQLVIDDDNGRIYILF